MTSKWNTPRVFFRTAILHTDVERDVSLSCTTHALLDTKRPWCLSAHVTDVTGVFTCTRPLASGQDAACVHGSGATIAISKVSVLPNKVSFRAALHGRAFKLEASVRFVIHTSFSNDAAALCEFIYVPALKHARKLCNGVIDSPDTDAAFKRANVLISEMLTRARVPRVDVPDVFTDQECADLLTWTAAHPTAHVPDVHTVPLRFVHSAYESTYLALGAEMLAAAQQCSIMKRIDAFTACEPFRGALERISARVNDVYSVRNLLAAERETNSTGQWLRLLCADVHALTALIDACMRETV